MRYCCEKCFSNKYLKEYILSERNVGKCDYCNSNGVNIISTGEIGAYIRECLKKAYEDMKMVQGRIGTQKRNNIAIGQEGV